MIAEGATCCLHRAGTVAKRPTRLAERPKQCRTGRCSRQRKLRWIGYLSEIQTCCGCGISCNCPISSCEQFAYPTLLLPAITHGKQGTCNVSHHVVQKRICTDIEYDEITCPTHCYAMDISHWAVGLASRCAKRTEVLFSQQVLCCIMHCLGIQRATMPRYQIAKQRRPYRNIGHNVAVASGLG